MVAHSLGFEYLQPWQKRRLEEAFAQGKRKVKVGEHLASDSMLSFKTPKRQVRFLYNERNTLQGDLTNGWDNSRGRGRVTYPSACT